MLQIEQVQTIPKLFRYSAIPLFLVALSCSGLTSKSRTSSQDTSEGSSANSQSQAGGGNFTPSKNDESSPPEVVSGSYLTSYCVTDAQNACSKVRFIAKVKTSSGDLVRLAVDSIRPLGLKKISWDIPSLHGKYSCEFTSGLFAFNPLCTATGDGSLKSTVIKATLTLVSSTETTSKIESSNTTPVADKTIQGNFMLVDSSPGLRVPVSPEVRRYSEASADFTQIWQDLVSGNYLTNVLYDGGGTPSGTDWGKSMNLCASVNSGDGAGKWRLPTVEELCGTGYASGICNGGLKLDGINSVTFDGGSWSGHYFWSSSSVNAAKAWSALLSNGSSGESDKYSFSQGVFCVRPPDTGVNHGNFMLLDARPGFTPSGKTGNGLDAPISGLQLFTQIWKDTISGLYMTNILYDGNGATNWDGSKALCLDIDSGDGAGKWHLPTGKELCGSGFDDTTYDDNPCHAGLYGHGLTDVPVVTGGKSWLGNDGINYIWSSSPASSGNAWAVSLSPGSASSSGKTLTYYGAFCVR